VLPKSGQKRLEDITSGKPLPETVEEKRKALKRGQRETRRHSHDDRKQDHQRVGYGCGLDALRQNMKLPRNSNESTAQQDEQPDRAIHDDRERGAGLLIG